MNLPKINPCPDCKGRDLDLSNIFPNKWRVMCRDCGFCKGMGEPSKKAAIELWNKQVIT